MGLEREVGTLGPLAKRHRAILRGMGIDTVGDLLFHFPNRYEDFTERASASDIVDGRQATLVATVAKVANRRSFRRRMTVTEAVLDDGTGQVTALWFNQPYLVRTLVVGRTYRFAGKAAKTRFGLRIMNPLYEAEGTDGGGYVAPLMPVYPLVAGISQHAVRKIIHAAATDAALISDPLPEAVLGQYGLVGLSRAIRGAHWPKDVAERDAARRRLAFDELLKIQLSIGKMRRLRETRPAPVVACDEAATKAFVASLPFTLTDDQRKAAWAALKDMEKGRQMHRLLDGDVGSGKTIVAAVAMMNAALSGYQSALMAPTEILARQHYETLRGLFAGQRREVVLWTNAYKRSSLATKETVYKGKGEVAALGAAIAEGNAPFVVGTHALVEESLSFSRLALAVVDEQHRFGVRTRSLLCAKSGMPGFEPHLLSMTATPIPRSLALTLFGDLDLSVLREKPRGRKDIETTLVTPGKRKKAYSFVKSEVAAGRQAFVVCPLIDPSDLLGAASVTEEFERLRAEDLSGIPMGMLHGKLSSAEKEAVMRDFLDRKLMVLVSTSVIEVGVDVPNASVMAIEGAERFGLSQLHQFRGRVGRGDAQSYCFLLPGTMSLGVKTRLEAVVRHADGFTLAEKDLELRGPGDLLGVEQSGFPALRMATFGDARLIADAKDAAAHILAVDPELLAHPDLKRYVAISAEKAHLE
jgi:ATP-dependent DNA helicase RecG